MIVVFYEDNEQFVVRALDGVEQRWREEVKKQHLNIWLKQAADARRLRRQDTLLLVAPETALVRRIIMLPSQTKPTQQRAMAANALTAELKERPAALAVQMLDAEGRCAVWLHGEKTAIPHGPLRSLCATSAHRRCGGFCRGAAARSGGWLVSAFCGALERHCRCAKRTRYRRARR